MRSSRIISVCIILVIALLSLTPVSASAATKLALDFSLSKLTNSTFEKVTDFFSSAASTTSYVPAVTAIQNVFVKEPVVVKNTVTTPTKKIAQVVVKNSSQSSDENLFAARVFSSLLRGVLDRVTALESAPRQVVQNSYVTNSSNGGGYSYSYPSVNSASTGFVQDSVSAVSSLLSSRIAALENSSSTSSQWSQTGNNISYNQGNVGIGTTTPGAALTVTGDVVASSFYGDGSHLTGVTSFSTSTVRNVFSSNSPSLVYDNTQGVFTLSTSSLGLLTTDVTEGSNLYFNNARARNALSSSATGLSYATSTGVFSLTSGYTIPLTASTTAWDASNASSSIFSTFFTTPSSRITAGTGLTWSGNTLNSTAATNTDALTEGTTNKYFSNTLARSSLSSSATGLSYATSTGIFSLTSGYNIPTVASTTEWASKVASQWTTNGSDISYTSGNVGIGSVNSSEGALKVNGSVYSTAAETDSILNGSLPGWQNKANFIGSGAWWGLRSGTDHSFNLDMLGSNALTVKQNGNVGIGSTTPGSRLSVAGNVTANAFYGDGSNLTGIVSFATSTTRSVFSSSATGLSYATSTGIFSLASGYAISTIASTTEWANTVALTNTLNASTTNLSTFFTTPSTRIAAGTGLSWSGNILNSTAATNTDALTEGLTNLYFNNTRARNALSSSATGLSYATSTGVFSLTSGYTIPLTASTTAWDAKVGSQWATNGANISFVSGNVGIGTTTPTAKLTVTGTTLFGGALTSGGTGTSTTPYIYYNNGVSPSTWNTNGTVFGANISLTDTSANFLDFHNNGSASVFNVDRNGSIYSNYNATIYNGINVGTNGVGGGLFGNAIAVSPSLSGYPSAGGVSVRSTDIFGWANSTTWYNPIDTLLSRFSAGVLAVGNASSTIGGSLLAGKIGVGTTSVSNALTVVGSSTFTGNVTANAFYGDGSNLTGIRPLFSSTATGLTYASSTGVFSLTSGYAIPTTASTTEWATALASTTAFNTFFTTPSSRITAGTNLSWSGNTLNYVGATSSSQWTTSGSDVYFNTGNVGIGSTTPGSKLSVGGDITTTGLLNILGAGTSTINSNILLSGDIIPSADNTYRLGSPSRMWRDVYIGPGSLYVNGQKVLQTDVSNNVTVTADTNQNLVFKTAGTGDLELNPSGTGQILLKGNLRLSAGKTITTSDASPVVFSNGVDAGNLRLFNNTLTAINLNGGISLAATGTGGVYVTQGNFGIGTTTPGSPLTVAGNGLFTGNVTASAFYGDGSNLTGISTLSTSTVRSLFSSSATGLSYATSTGVFSLTSGYTIPLTASTTAWDAKVGSQWATNGGNISYVSGNVGIGTTTPAAKLAITGLGASGLNTTFLLANSSDTPVFSVDDAGRTYMAASGGLFVGTTTSVSGVSNYISNFNNFTGLVLKKIASGAGDYLDLQNASGNSQFTVKSSGNVGIGTASPSKSLQVNGTSGMRLSYDAAHYTDFVPALDGATGVSVNGATKFYIGASSLTGIEIPAAYSIAFVNPTITTYGNLKFSTSTSKFTFRNGTDTGDADVSLGSLVTSGNVGIGTTTPQDKLDVNGNIRFDGSANSVGLFSVSNQGNQIFSLTRQPLPTGASLSISSLGGLGIATNASSPSTAYSLVVSSTGNVGIGTTSPSAKLDVYGTAGSADIFALSSSTNARLFTVSANGNVGIGTTTPGFKLDVTGDGSAVGAIANFSTTQSAIYTGIANMYAPNLTAGQTGYFQMGRNGATNNSASWGLYYAGNGSMSNRQDFNFYGGSAVLSLLASGNVGIGTTTPGFKLSVAGDINLTGTLRANGDAGTAGYVLQSTGTTTQWVATSSLGISGGGGSLSGGTNGYLARWTSGSSLSSGLFLDDGTSAGINATSSQYTFNLQGTAGKDAFNVASSTGTSLFNISKGGNVAIGVASTTYMLDIQGTFGSQLVLGKSGQAGSLSLKRGDGAVTGSLGYTTAGETGIIRLQSGGGAGAIELFAAGGSVSVTAANTFHSIFAGNGSFGISTSTPLASLDVYGRAGVLDLFALSSSTNARLFTVKGNGNVGIGTSSPYALLTVAGESAATFFTASATTSTSTFAGGLNVNNGAIVHDWSAGLTSISNLALGAQSFDADSGMVSWIDMPVTSASASGTVQSYTSQLDGNPVFTVYGKSDGAGSVNSLAIGIGTTTPTLGPLTMASGAYVTAGGTWTNASDRNLKANFTPVNNEDILNKISQLPLTQWNYKSEATSTLHIGPMAQDFFAVFNLGGSDTSISTIDPAGVALAGIQALNEQINGVAASTTGGVNTAATSTVAGGIGQTLFSKILKSFDNVGVKITESVSYFKDIFADKVSTKLLCVGDTCVTEAQLKTLLQSAGQTPTPAPAPVPPAPTEPTPPTGDGSTTPADTGTPNTPPAAPAPDPTPAPESAPAPAPAGDSAPAL